MRRPGQMEQRGADQANRVLFVEDDPEIGRLVSRELARIDYDVTWEADGREGYERFENEAFDLIILDLRLPSMDGLEICEEIRADDPLVPIVMLTAKAEKRDVVRGLEIGADDYITKPFSTSELIARIGALFRRIDADRGEAGENESLRFDGLTIDPRRRRIFRDGDEVHLTAKEFDLLHLFARHPGTAFSRTELLTKVWGEEFDGYDHTVNTHINRLRKKIEPEPSSPTYIETVWGVGYRFNESTSQGT